jgi:hypothetical protein
MIPVSPRKGSKLLDYEPATTTRLPPSDPPAASEDGSTAEGSFKLGALSTLWSRRSASVSSVASSSNESPPQSEEVSDSSNLPDEAATSEHDAAADSASVQHVPSPAVPSDSHCGATVTVPQAPTWGAARAISMESLTAVAAEEALLLERRRAGWHSSRSRGLSDMHASSSQNSLSPAPAGLAAPSSLLLSPQATSLNYSSPSVPLQLAASGDSSRTSVGSSVAAAGCTVGLDVETPSGAHEGSGSPRGPHHGRSLSSASAGAAGAVLAPQAGAPIRATIEEPPSSSIPGNVTAPTAPSNRLWRRQLLPTDLPPWLATSYATRDAALSAEAELISRSGRERTPQSLSGLEQTKDWQAAAKALASSRASLSPNGSSAACTAVPRATLSSAKPRSPPSAPFLRGSESARSVSSELSDIAAAMLAAAAAAYHSHTPCSPRPLPTFVPSPIADERATRAPAGSLSRKKWAE